MPSKNRRLYKGKKDIGSKTSTICHRVTNKDLDDWVISPLPLTSHQSHMNNHPHPPPATPISAMLNYLHFWHWTLPHSGPLLSAWFTSVHSFSSQRLHSCLFLQLHSPVGDPVQPSPQLAAHLNPTASRTFLTQWLSVQCVVTRCSLTCLPPRRQMPPGQVLGLCSSLWSSISVPAFQRMDGVQKLHVYKNSL